MGENADPEFTAKHGSSKQQWARQPGTIGSRAANSALVSGVNLVSGASQHAPWVPDCLCGSVERCGRQSSLLSPCYWPRLAMPAPSQTRGAAPGGANEGFRTHLLHSLWQNVTPPWAKPAWVMTACRNQVPIMQKRHLCLFDWSLITI